MVDLISFIKYENGLATQSWDTIETCLFFRSHIVRALFLVNFWVEFVSQNKIYSRDQLEICLSSAKLSK